MPPPTPTSVSPARIALSSRPTARTLEAQTLLIVSEETSLGMPALICAWRDGIWPCPAWSTWPITTWSPWSGATSARSSAASTARPRRSVASRVERPPPSLPIGVRAEDRITVLGIGMALSGSKFEGREPYRSGYGPPPHGSERHHPGPGGDRGGHDRRRAVRRRVPGRPRRRAGGVRRGQGQAPARGRHARRRDALAGRRPGPAGGLGRRGRPGRGRRGRGARPG